MAKAALWHCTDAEARKRGEQTGLDTLVVHALNGGHRCRARKGSVPKETIKCPAWGVRPQG